MVSTQKHTRGYINLTNTGNTALNDYQILNSNIEGISSFIDPLNNLRSRIILPNQSSKIQFNFPSDKLKYEEIEIDLLLQNSGIFEKEINLKTPLGKDTPYSLRIGSKVLSILLFVILLLLIYLGIRFVRKKKNG